MPHMPHDYGFRTIQIKEDLKQSIAAYCDAHHIKQYLAIEAAWQIFLHEQQRLDAITAAFEGK